jgi:hypothetical protein
MRNLYNLLTIIPRLPTTDNGHLIILKLLSPLVEGNPVKQTGWRSEYGHEVYFDEQGFAECPESGQPIV